MKVFSIILFNVAGSSPVILSSASDLSQFGFWKRSTVREILTFVSRELVSRTSIGQQQSVFHDLKEPVDGVNKFLCHASVNSKQIGSVVITDGDYNSRVAQFFGGKAVEMLDDQHGDKIYKTQTADQTLKVVGLDELLQKYQNPQEVDALLRIQKDLNETREIMVQNIDKLLQRGERIEDLLDKTNDLSDHSKLFVKRSKDLNKCCIII